MSTDAVAANTVFIVDDDDAFRDSLGWLLESASHTIRTFASGEAFLQAYRGEPGCLLLDIRMPGISGLALQQELNRRGLRLPIIVITGHGDIAMAVSAIKNGAVDFIEKPFDDRVLLDHVTRALTLAERWHQASRQRQQVLALWETLSRREKQVMELVVSGMANKVIAEALDISPKTVEVHRARVMSKMRADSLPELVKQWHLIETPPVGARSPGE
jgi:two-component system response regulator TtrR